MAVRTFKWTERNIINLLEIQRGGEMKINKLEDCYTRRFNQDIQWALYGFDSLKEMLCSIKRDVVVIDDVVRLKQFDCKEIEKEVNHNKLSCANDGKIKQNCAWNRAPRGMRNNNQGRNSSIFTSNNWVLKVENFHEDTEQEELEELFRPYKFLEIIIRTDVPSIFALVEIEDYDAACEAFCTLDGSLFLGKNLKVKFDRSSIAGNQNFEGRTGRGGGGRGRGGGGRGGGGRGRQGDLCGIYHRERGRREAFKCEEGWPPLNQRDGSDQWTTNIEKDKEDKYLVDPCNLEFGDEEEKTGHNLDGMQSETGQESKSLCMEPEQIRKMFLDTGTPTFTNIAELSSEINLLSFEGITCNFFWAVVVNEGKWVDEVAELARKMENLDCLDPATEKDKRVCKKCDGVFCRAWVAEEISEDLVKLFYLDYGTIEETSRKDLYLLPNYVWEFCPMAFPFYCPDLPPLAIMKESFLKATIVSKYDEHIFCLDGLKLVKSIS